MLILAEGGFEWREEDQAHLGVPADSNCPDTTQPGKTWNVKFAHGTCFWPSPSFINHNASTILGTETGKAQLGRGGDILQALQLVDHGLWDHPAMDPNSCGVIAAFAPIGPWPLSEHSSSSSFPPRSSYNFAGALPMVPLHYKGTNPEEQQRLRMLGMLEAQNIKVSRHCSSSSCSNQFIPFLGAIGVPWWTQEYAHREWFPRGCGRSLVPHGRSRSVIYSLHIPPLRSSARTSS